MSKNKKEFRIFVNKVEEFGTDNAIKRILKDEGFNLENEIMVDIDYETNEYVYTEVKLGD